LRVSGQPGSNVSASAAGNPNRLTIIGTVYPAAAALEPAGNPIGCIESGRDRNNNKKPLFFRPILGIAAANAGLN
jgi:hypothetical protein